jgi:hypothetical protein
LACYHAVTGSGVAPTDDAIRHDAYGARQLRKMIDEMGGAIHPKEAVIHRTKRAIDRMEGTAHGTEAMIHRMEGTIHGTEGTIHRTKCAIDRMETPIHRAVGVILEMARVALAFARGYLRRAIPIQERRTC